MDDSLLDKITVRRKMPLPAPYLSPTTDVFFPLDLIADHVFGTYVYEKLDVLDIFQLRQCSKKMREICSSFRPEHLNLPLKLLSSGKPAALICRAALQRYGQHIRSVNIKDIVPVEYLEMIRTFCKNIRSFRMDLRETMPCVDSIVNIIEECGQLERLDLRNSWSMGQTSLWRVVECLPDTITELSVRNAGKACGDSVLLSIVNYLKNLQSLDLSYCGFTDEGLRIATDSWVSLPNIRVLGLCSANISNSTLLNLLSEMKIEELELSEMSNIGDEFLLDFAAQGHEELRVFRCNSYEVDFDMIRDRPKSFSEVGIRALVENSSLRELEVSYHEGVASGFAYSAPLLEECTVLNISNCYKINEKVLAAVFSNLRNLCSLDIEHNINVVDDCIDGLCGLKHLKRLNLRNCTSLTDSAMKKISSAEFTLEFLSIGECFRITGKGIESLVFGQTMLEELCISGIRNLSVTLLECIIQSCPFLRVLNSTAMQGIRMEEYEVFWNRWVSTCELTGEMDFLSSGK